MILFSTPIHLGDTASPEVFQNVPFIGLRLALPLTLSATSAADSLTLRFTTSKLETWAPWQRHRVYLQEELIGELADTGDAAGTEEVHILPVTGEVLARMPRFVMLRIEVGQQDPGLSDDFLLKEITAEGVTVLSGWVLENSNAFHGTLNGGGADLSPDAPIISGGGADLPDNAPVINGGNASTR
jgi:hypothetical protein